MTVVPIGAMTNTAVLFQNSLNQNKESNNILSNKENIILNSDLKTITKKRHSFLPPIMRQSSKWDNLKIKNIHDHYRAYITAFGYLEVHTYTFEYLINSTYGPR